DIELGHGVIRARVARAHVAASGHEHAKGSARHPSRLANPRDNLEAHRLMLTLLAIISVGFVLGMRHATDADHVVAVTTIVSRERSLGPAAWLGALWGVGHTVTIVIVGGAIILFNVV